MVVYKPPPFFSVLITKMVGFRTQHRCFFCGTDDFYKECRANLEHLQPKSRGGTNTETNLVVACVTCNSDKGDMTLEEYREVIQLNQMLFSMRVGVMPRVPKITFYGENI